MGAERAKNLKRGWREERDARAELSQRLATSENSLAAAAETLRAWKAAEADRKVAQAEAAETQHGPAEHSAAAGSGEAASERPAPPMPPRASTPPPRLVRETRLPRPGGGGSAAAPAPSQLPAPNPRIKDLEGKVQAAREEATRAAEAARLDKARLAALQKEHTPLLAEAKELRKRQYAFDALKTRIAEQSSKLAKVPRRLGALRWRLLAAGIERPQLHGLRGTLRASRLARTRLEHFLASARGSLHGERWRGAGALWRFLERARLARSLERWARSIAVLRITYRYETTLGEVERRGEATTHQSEAEREAALEKLRKAADGKLRKERALATTRMLERDALARQVTQLQAQLRHAAALRHPSPGQDTYVPTSAAGSGVAWAKGRGGRGGGAANGGRTSSEGAENDPKGGHDENEGHGGAETRRRPAVPKRSVGATPTLLEEEAKELREALTASKNERDVLQCEVHALRLELEATRELLN